MKNIIGTRGELELLPEKEPETVVAVLDHMDDFVISLLGNDIPGGQCCPLTHSRIAREDERESKRYIR
ncbi:hypothetical protein GWN60_07605 [candidate division KSB1 bacterium]|nr:hypothetical protein [candidate division KSB1 bacterium]NIR69542.1 hypothetical protein [candidate division KSB1 bacterium]NIU90595.1 hypothetical protein [candidate division KSB1 bacterium]